MLREGHYAPEAIQSRLQEMEELWDELLGNCHEKRTKLQDAYKVKLETGPVAISCDRARQQC